MEEDQTHFGVEYHPEFANQAPGQSPGGQILRGFRLDRERPPPRKRKAKEEVKPRKRQGHGLRIDIPIGPQLSATMPNTPASDTASSATTPLSTASAPPTFGDVAEPPGAFMSMWRLPTASAPGRKIGSATLSRTSSFGDTALALPSNPFMTPEVRRAKSTSLAPILSPFDPNATPISNPSGSFRMDTSFEPGEQSPLPAPTFDIPFQSTPGPSSQKNTDPSLGDPEFVKSILERLRKVRMTPTEMLSIILDPANLGLSDFRNKFYDEANHERIFSILDRVRKHKKTEGPFKEWMAEPAMELVSRKVFDEVVAAKPLLRMETKDISTEYVENWSVQEIMEPVIAKTPVLTRILTTATSRKYPPPALASKDRENEDGDKGEDDDDDEDREPEAKENEGRNRPVARLIIASQIHYLHSHFSCKVQLGLGVVAWANGCSQQLNDLLHQSALVRCHSSNLKAIEIVSERGLDQARVVADGPHICAWDNVQVSTSIFVEQTDDTRAKVQSGTFPVIYKAPPGVTKEDMLLQPIIEARKNAPALKMSDIRASPSQLKAYRHNTRINIIKMLCKHIPGFKVYADYEALKHLSISPLPEGYRTEYYPLYVVPIEEASMKGNNLVIDNIYFAQLLKQLEHLNEYAVISCNDQLTNSRIRSVQINRKHDLGGFNTRQFLELAVALFHLVMNLIWALKEKHYGTINEMASIAQLFALLDKTRLAGSKPDYHSLLAALTQILEGLILNVWEAECPFNNLGAFADSKPTPSELLAIAERIIRNHATPSPTFVPAYTPRKSATTESASSPAAQPETDQDPVRENIIRLTRDLLLVVELVSAIKDGDFGRVECVLPDLVFIFRGAGSNNYSTEILHLIHSFKYVWNEEFARAIRATLIINISGIPGHGMGIDLNIEHLIRYLKSLFVAKGIYSKWERASHISASINIVMLLKRRVARSLHLRYQGSTHTPAKTTALVQRMQAKAKELELHKVCLNRQDSASLKPDLRALGQQRIESTSLAAFNAKLEDMKSPTYELAEDELLQEADELESVQMHVPNLVVEEGGEAEAD